MSGFGVPSGMTRRHFFQHLAGAAAMAAPATTFANTLLANAADMKKRHKSAILLWMGGGPSTIDLWDLKPNAPTGGQFKPISTSADGVQISEHLPLVAKQMHHLSIVRSMSTREADHGRGRYYMHTGYVPDPNMEHPSYGSVIAHELASQSPQLEIPPFVSVGGGSEGPGFLGMTWAPFVVNSNGDVRNLNMPIDAQRLAQRQAMLKGMETQFAAHIAGVRPTALGSDRKNDSAARELELKAGLAIDHDKVVNKAWNLMTSKQMEAFRVNQEPPAMREKYGNTGFGRGCLMARRLVEIGVPFVEVDLGGWDNHGNIFPTLQNQKLPEMDRAMSALVTDLAERGLLDDTAIVWMGEFGRTPRINGGAGRDHWARSWSVVVGGAGFKRGITVGSTNADGTEVDSEPYKSEDLMASVLKALGLSLETTFTSKSGRPMKIANSGKAIKDLLA